MNLVTTSLRGRPRNKWQDGMREDGRIVGEEGGQEKVHSREEWKKHLKTVRNHHILHMPMERMNGIMHQLCILLNSGFTHGVYCVYLKLPLRFCHVSAQRTVFELQV